MQAVARMGILVFVFTIPWENMVVIPGVGTISRLAGMGAFGLGLIAFLLQPQFRNMQTFHGLFLGFVMYSAISYGWSLDQTLSIERIGSNLQLVLFVWLIWQFVENERHVLQNFQFYVLGAMVAAIGTVAAYLSGVEVVYLRYSAEGFDPNELSIILALAIPMAWYLSMRYSSVALVWGNRLLIPVLLVAILLTGSRTGLVVASVGLLFLISTLTRGSVGNKLTLVLLLVLGIVMLPQLIPESTWMRLSTLEEEIVSGTMNNRTTIWLAGFGIWLDHLATGVGAGSFPAAVQLVLGSRAAPHNSFLSILVELGAVGFLLFAAMMVVIWQQTRRLTLLERHLYITLFIILSLGLFTLTWETKKPIWLLCNLLLCHVAVCFDSKKHVAENDSELTSGTNKPPRLLQAKMSQRLLNTK